MGGEGEGGARLGTPPQIHNNFQKHHTTGTTCLWSKEVVRIEKNHNMKPL